MHQSDNMTKSGFTLIEISIVLVIIGLIIGGILVGQDMISAAAVRAQISQIEKYNTAVHTFQNKYGYLPGDIPDPYASNFGFGARGAYAGQGDGNGVIEGCSPNAAGNNAGAWGGVGETAIFWVDLSIAGLIDSNIASSGVNYPSITATPADRQAATTPAIKDWLPAAKLGQSNFVSIFSLTGTNYFSVFAVTDIIRYISGNAGLTVQQAYNIDSKIDDGLPQSGSVMDYFISGVGSVAWAAGGGYGTGSASGNCGGVAGNCLPSTSSTPGSASTCYDNSSASSGTPGVAGATQHYSLEIKGSSLNCALSFKFQ